MITPATRPARSHPIAYAAGATLLAWFASAWREGTEVRIATVALLPAWWAAVVDLRSQRVPDRLVVLVAATSLTASVLLHATLTSPLLGAATMALPLLVVHLLDPAQVGFGDVKLGAAIGAALGIVDARAALVSLMAASLLGLLGAAAWRRFAVPFAPALVLSASIVVVAPVAPWGSGR
jgi:leader peptidase (prepilin peptidase)/N-methyltransferase